jgi:hypothetical protein
MRQFLSALVVIIGVSACHRPSAGPAETLPEAGNYQIRTLAFYNVENLFDTADDTLVADSERTPEGSYRWTGDRYNKKLRDISEIVSAIGRLEAKRSPDLIGLCEIENRGVLNDLLAQDALRHTNYGIIHYDSPDRRGIDVALLYNKEVFLPLESQSRRLLLSDPQGFRKYTRDQLVVYGYLDAEPIFLSVNHWPSRSGGQRKSETYRRQAAALQRSILDSILRLIPDARYISMGDFNDDPTDISIKYGMGTAPVSDSIASGTFFNPMEALFANGNGSLAYRDQWNLFDQILLNGNWFENDKGFRFWKARIYRPDKLVTKAGPYSGYPFRTYAGGQYTGGYSDHFPVYLLLIRPLTPTAE